MALWLDWEPPRPSDSWLQRAPGRAPSASAVGKALCSDEGCALSREPGECKTAPWNYLLDGAQWLWVKDLETLERAHAGRPRPLSWPAPTFPGHVYLAGGGGVGEIAQNIKEPTRPPTTLA